MEYLLYLGALALIAVGLAGTVIPAIPGLPIIFAGSWLIGWASGYELISVTAVVILALLAAVGIGIDILAQILGAKRAGASRAGLLGRCDRHRGGAGYRDLGHCLLPADRSGDR